MTYKIFLFLFVCIYVLSCAKKTNKFVVIGQVNGVNTDSLFIAEAHEWDKPLNYTVIKNGKFKLELNLTDSKLLMVSIGYKNKNGKIKLFEFVNRALDTTGKIGHLYSSFFLDKDTIEINNTKDESPYFEISAGLETLAMYRTQMINFGYFDPTFEKRSIQLQQYTDIIDKYPHSKYLLSLIDDNKSVINKNELSLLLKHFDQDVVKTELGESLILYTKKKNDTPVYSNRFLENQYGVSKKMIDSTAKINMVVIWASWCGPCRKEIPELKKLYTEYNSKGLRLVSISIDNNVEAWQSALREEKMSWEQLIIPENIKKSFAQEFEISTVPDVLFLSNNGKLISRTIGVDENTSNTYKRIIEEGLRK